MRWRLRSVRTRILLLVLVPVLSLVGVYAFATSIAARDAFSLAKANTVKRATGDPTGAFIGQIDAERTLAIVYLSAPTGANLATLELQETKTNTAVVTLRSALTSSQTTNNASPTEKQAIAALLRGTTGLPSLRSQIAAQIITRPRTFASYNTLVDDAYRVLNAAIRQQNNPVVVAQGLGFVRMAQSEDLLLQENTLLIADLDSGHISAADLRQFTELAGARRTIYSLTLPDLDPAYRAYYDRDVSPQALTSLASMENTVMNTRPGTLPQIAPSEWQQVVGSVSTGLGAAGTQAADTLTSQANAQARGTYLRLILIGGLGLLAIIVSIILSLWIGRRQVRDLSDLRESAEELANERLPDVVTRLAAGEDVDVPQALPVSASSDEIGQVREAFTKVQQTAVEAAVGQAQLRRGISHIFRNLARRSQSLLHRQLTLLDAMERRVSDPQELEDLFRVNHLATRMRRHAESLIILSGEAPARGWRHPVPLVDVLRAAVAEVEDYTRIKVTASTQASLAGPAVGDVIHMIAELAENATIYSPPQTPVTITGSIVGQGFAVEIEDRGLGMTPTQRDEINAQLGNPPAFDLSGSDQLGLFVAGQLAKRQNIRISMRPSPYGGTTAIVLIPRSLVVPEGTAAGDGSSLPVGATQARHAIGSRNELAGPDGRESSPDGRESSPPAPSMPVAASALRAEPEPGRDGPGWPESSLTSPVGPAAPPGRRLRTGHRGPGPAGEGATVYPVDPLSPPPLAKRTPLDPAGGNGPGRADPVTADGTAGGGPDDGVLPRRIRQASLVPQLRNSPPRPAPRADLGIPSGPPPELGIPSERSPEETRATMSAIQRGWERGRSVFDPSGSDGGGAASGVMDATDAMEAVPDAESAPGPGASAGTGGVPGPDGPPPGPDPGPPGPDPEPLGVDPGPPGVDPGPPGVDLGPPGVDPGPPGADPGAPGADPGSTPGAGIAADPAAGWPEGDAASASTHRGED